jgi:glucose-1-phosphate cytidylyltransferase
VKAVILAGGFGTRISEESYLKPKPMIEIGGMPIIWHIMKIYSAHGINDFVVCLGYKGYVIKEYFANHFLHMSDVTIDMANNSIEVHRRNAIPWKVTLVDTGEATLTGRFGALGIEQQLITHFQEKPRGDGAWVNGGFFVCQPSVLDYIEGDGATMAWEQEPLEGLARDRSLAAYFHRGFWQPMDTLRDKQHLEELWAGGAPPWKVWQ